MNRELKEEIIKLKKQVKRIETCERLCTGTAENNYKYSIESWRINPTFCKFQDLIFNIFQEDYATTKAVLLQMKLLHPDTFFQFACRSSLWTQLIIETGFGDYLIANRW